eukprot:Seg1945.8 transcript_id=Seg1945.8/GoldUCD/mRNA.D3Y31 product="E3 ubiquitin-protein ligase RNF165" protein_id=Seg1945.8/GoldUCD/D3Y31
MPENTTERVSHLRGQLSKFINLGLCVSGIVFIIIGVFRSTLLLYVGCALVGAAVGGFIRSRLPIHSMIPSTGLHVVYRSELQRNVQAYHDGLQTFVVMHSQQPCGIGQKKINQYTTITKFASNMIFLNTESFDKISMISALTERTESGDACCIICLIQFKNGQDVRQLPCQHMFHITCIDKWLKINRLCPTCRLDITLPSKAKEIPSTSEIEVHAQLNIINHENTENDVVENEGDLSPVASTSITVDPEEISSSNVREDDIVTENGVRQSLTSFASASSVIVQMEDPNSATTAL